MRRKKEVTMQDIADKLGISKVTVSKALNNKEGVGSELKQKIQIIAVETGYKITKRSGEQREAPGNIAIFIKEKFTGDNPSFYLRLYQKLSGALGKKGYLATLITTDSLNQSRIDLAGLLSSSSISGVILLGDVGEHFLKEVKNIRVPFILVDFFDMASDVTSVITENIYSTYELTNHLLECGHRDIGFVGTVYSTASICDRFLGYSRSLIEMKLPINQEWIIKDRDEDNELIDFVLPDKLPTAFVCNCDDTAYHFVNFLNKQGLDVPEDISVVSFDNDTFAEICVPKLTTVAVDIQTMVKQSVYLIIEKIETAGELKGDVHFVNGKIIYRDSVKRLCPDPSDSGG